MIDKNKTFILSLMIFFKIKFWISKIELITHVILTFRDLLLFNKYMVYKNNYQVR